MFQGSDFDPWMRLYSVDLFAFLKVDLLFRFTLLKDFLWHLEWVKLSFISVVVVLELLWTGAVSCQDVVVGLSFHYRKVKLCVVLLVFNYPLTGLRFLFAGVGLLFEFQKPLKV